MPDFDYLNRTVHCDILDASAQGITKAHLGA